MKATVFLGGGRITSALVAGLRLAGYQRPLVAYDRHPAKLRTLRRDFRVGVARDLKSAIQRAELLIIAVRPDAVVPLLDEVARCGAVAQPTLAVSLAAGVPLRKLRPYLRGSHWVRAMPSPVCRIGRGLTAVTFDRSAMLRDRRRVREFFAHVGSVLEISEKRFDAFTVAYSPSHGYHALATLAQAAQDAGLDRKTALAAAAHALADGILYWRESGQSLDKLLEEAATPGGTAAATMQAMDRAGYAKIVSQALAAGMKQASENAKR